MNQNEVDIGAILARLKLLEQKAQEFERLKHEIEEMKSLEDLGSDVAGEVQSEINNNELIANVEMLNKNDITIPFLHNKIDEIPFKNPRLDRGTKYAKPLLESEILEAQKLNLSARKTAKKLRVSYPTYKKYCKMYNIFKVKDKKEKRPKTSLVNPNKGKYPISKILNGEFPDFPIHRLKDKLIRAGIKKAECEQCGFKERRITDGKLPLLMNFEDDDRRNHKLENIKILCYNCTIVSGTGYLRKGTSAFNLDPDVLQGANFPLPARF